MSKIMRLLTLGRWPESTTSAPPEPRISRELPLTKALASSAEKKA